MSRMSSRKTEATKGKERSTMKNFVNTNDESIPLTKPNKTSRNTKTAWKRRGSRLERAKEETNRDLNEALTCQYETFNGNIRFLNQEEGSQYNDKANEEKDPVIPSILRRKQDLNSVSAGKAYESHAKRSLLNMNSISNSVVAHLHPPVASTSCVNSGVDRDSDIATVPHVSYQCDNLNDRKSAEDPSCNTALSKVDLRKSIINSISKSINVKKDEPSVRNSHLNRKLLSNVKAAPTKPGTSSKHVLTINVDENVNQTTKRNCVPEIDLREVSKRSMATRESKESELVGANRRTVAYSGGRKAGHVYEERKTGLLNTTPASECRQSKSIPLTKPNKTSRNTETAWKRRGSRLERAKEETNRDLNEALTCQYATFNANIGFLNQEEGSQYNDKANEEKDPVIPSILRRKQDLNSVSTGKAYESHAKRSLLNMNSISNSVVAHLHPPVASTSCVNNGVDRDNDIATVCDNLNDRQSTKDPSCNAALSKVDLRKSIINSISKSINVKKDESSVRNSHLNRKLLSNVKAAPTKPGTSSKHVLTINVDENVNQTTKRNCVPEIDLREVSKRSMATRESKESELVGANRRTVAYSGGRKAGHVYEERKTGLLNTTPASECRQSKSIPLTKPNKTSRNTETAWKRRGSRLERAKEETNRDLNEALTCQYETFNGNIRFLNQEEGSQYNDKANEEKDPVIPSILRRKQDLNSVSAGKAYESHAKRSLLNMNSISNSVVAHLHPPVASTSCVNSGVDRDSDIATVPHVSYQCDNLNDRKSAEDPSCNTALSKVDLRKSIINSISKSINVKKDEPSVRNSHLNRKLLSNVKAAPTKPGTSSKHVLTINVDENVNQTTKRNCVPEVDLREVSKRSMATRESKESELVGANERTVAYSGGRKAGHVYQERKTGLLNTNPASACRQSKPIPSFANHRKFPFRLEKNDPVFAHIPQSSNISPPPVTALIRRRFNANCTLTGRRVVSFSDGQSVYGGMGDYNRYQGSAYDGIKRASLTLIRPNLSLSTGLDIHLIISNATKRILSSLNGRNALLIEAMKIANKLKVDVFNPWDGFNRNKSKDSNVLRLSRMRTPYSRRTLQRKRSENVHQNNEHDADDTTILPPAIVELHSHTNKIGNKITNFGRGVSALDVTDEASTPPINLPKISFPVMEALLQFDTELPVPPVSSGIAVLSKQQESASKCKVTQDDQTNTTLTISTVPEPILAAEASTFDVQNMKSKDMQCSKVSSLTHFDQDGKHCKIETCWKRGSVLAALSNKETLISPEAIALQNSCNNFGSEFKNRNNKPEFADIQKTLSNI